MIKKISLAVISCFIFTTGFSQKDESTKITIFKPEDSTPTTSSSPTAPTTETNCIKWNYALLTRGVFLINYERPIQKMLSAEVGLGLTYRDFMYEALKTEDFYMMDYKAKYGFAVEGGIRFFPKDFDDYEGFYISPVVSYRKYNFENPSNVSGGSFSQPVVYTGSSSFKPGYSFVDLQFKLGYCYESFWFDDLIGEFYVGVAMRNATINYYADNGNNVYLSSTKKINDPQFLIGFKFGVPF